MDILLREKKTDMLLICVRIVFSKTFDEKKRLIVPPCFFCSFWFPGCGITQAQGITGDVAFLPVIERVRGDIEKSACATYISMFFKVKKPRESILCGKYSLIFFTCHRSSLAKRDKNE